MTTKRPTRTDPEDSNIDPVTMTALTSNTRIAQLTRERDESRAACDKLFATLSEIAAQRDVALSKLSQANDEIWRLNGSLIMEPMTDSQFAALNAQESEARAAINDETAQNRRPA